MTYPSEPNPYGAPGQPGQQGYSGQQGFPGQYGFPGQQGYPGQPPFAQGFPGQPPVQKKNTLGVLAVVFAAFFDICAIGLILGIVAVATAKGDERQKKFGWIAIGIAIAWGVITLILRAAGILDFSGSVSTSAS